MRVCRWGNSLAVRIPAALATELDFKEGDDVSLGTLEQARADEIRLEERRNLILELRKFRGLLPADFKFDREEANAR